MRNIFSSFLLGKSGTAVVDPSTISGLSLWYDVTDTETTTIVSGKISSILDKSGNNKTLTQSTSGSRPSYSATGGANNKPFITLTGNKFIGVTGLNIPKPYTVYTVAKNNTFNQYGNLYQLGDNFTHGIATFQQDGQSSLSLVADVAWRPFHNNYYFENQWFSNTAVFATTVYHDYRSSYIGFNKSKNFLFHDNPGNSAISKFYFGGTTYSADSDVSEVLVFDRELTYEEDMSVKHYLSVKYALAHKLGAYFHGDSITEGAAGTEPTLNGYVKLVSDGIGALCYNYGFSGTTVLTAGNGKALEDIYGYTINSDTRDYVFFNYGTNDTYSAEWAASYESIIQGYISSGHNRNKLVLLTPPYQSSRESKYNDMIPALEAIATNLGIRFINIHAATELAGGDSLLADGTHPTDAGHIVIANTIISALT